MRLLIIGSNKEDTEKLIEAFEDYFIIDTASDSAKSIYLSESNCYDTIIVNSPIEDIDSLEVCRMIRSLKVDSPILYLTDNESRGDSVMSYDAGVDVILFKPINTEEVIAQVRVLTRRNGSNKNCSNQISFGNITLDMKSKKFMVSNNPIFLRRKEYDLLEYLMINRGRTISKEEILEHVWEKGLDVFSNTVEVHVRNLRIKFKETFGINIIKTYRGFGYEIET